MFRVLAVDTGIGIMSEHQTRLFQPFAQVNNSATRAHEGTGLGLVITQKLVQAMGCDVTLSSTPSVGSIFTLSVTAVSNEAPTEIS